MLWIGSPLPCRFVFVLDNQSQLTNHLCVQMTTIIQACSPFHQSPWHFLLLPRPRVGVRAPDLLSCQGGHCWVEDEGIGLSWVRGRGARGGLEQQGVPEPGQGWPPWPMLPQANIPQLILLPVAEVKKWRHCESQALLGNGGVSYKSLTGFLGCNLHFPLQPRKQRLSLCKALGEDPAEDGGL